MKLTKKIVSLFILGLLLLPVAGRMVQASEESQLYDVDITYIFDGENANVDADLVNQVYGSTFGLTPVSAYAGYVWAYWIVNGVVRYDLPQNHTFRVTRNLVLQGVFAPEGKHTVVFLDSNGQLIESQFVDNNGTVTPPNVDNKSKPGLQVSATTPWRTSTGAVFNPAVGITSNMVIILQYETTVLGTYLMTVNGVEEGPYNFNQLVSVTADAEDLDETPFSHWEENGVMVSRNLNYVFTAVKDRTLTAVYSNTPSADLPLVVLTRDIELRSGYHTYIGQFYLTEGYEIVEYGFLIDNVNTLDLSKSNADYVVPAPSYTEASNEYVMSFPIGSHLNVRAYFTYKVGGSVLTVYSDENPRYIDDVLYREGFESIATWSSYPTTDTTKVFDGLDWTVKQVLLNADNTDKQTAEASIHGVQMLRFRGANVAYTYNNEYLPYISSISFDAKFYSSNTAIMKVSYQIEGGSWIELETIPLTFTYENYIININQSNVRVRIDVTVHSANVDNIQINSIYTGSTNVVTYDLEGTLDYDVVKRNFPMNEPNDPTKTGYTFDAWYLEETFVTPYNFANNVTSDLTLYAKFNINQYTIAFNSNGGSAVTSLVQNYNTEVTEPASPTRDGYLFDDWYSDVELTTPYVFDSMPAQNITLYAKWTLDTYDITYVLNGGTNNGSNPASYTIETSTTTLLEASKDGFTFNGWYDNAEFTGDPISEITLGSFGDVTLYAKFTEIIGNTYNVLVYDFEGDGNQLLYTIVVAEGDYATKPINDPTRVGYRFEDWYLDNAENPFEWETTSIIENITIFGVWIQTFTVSFNSNGGSSVSSQIVDINNYSIEPTPPTALGFTFIGWFDISLTNDFDFESTPIVSNITLYAKWNALLYTEDFTNSNLTATYADGSFVGNYGLTWTYGHSRNEDTFAINGNGIMLRRASDSYLQVTLANGVGSFSFDYRKAFTGTSARDLEIIVNGVQVAVTTTFGTTEPDTTVYNFSYNINVSGSVTIKIKNIGSTTTNRQAIIDNINWTYYMG